MEKNIMKKAGLCLLLSAAILTALYFLFRITVLNTVGLTQVYIASKDIPPRTRITPEYLTEISVPKAYIQDYAFASKEDIIGKYTEIQGMIPAGSLFYKRMLYDEEDLPDAPLTQLKEGETAYTMETDLANIGSVTAGMRVDVQVSVSQKDSYLSGCLLENVRVIAVKDHKGLSLDDPESTGIPYFTELAVKREYIDLLKTAELAGKLSLYASNAPYDTESETVLKEGDITDYLRSIRKKAENN